MFRRHRTVLFFSLLDFLEISEVVFVFLELKSIFVIIGKMSGTILYTSVVKLRNPLMSDGSKSSYELKSAAFSCRFV